MSATGSVGDSFGAGEEDEVKAADEVEACGSPLALHWHAITSHPQSEQRVTKSSWSAKVPGERVLCPRALSLDRKPSKGCASQAPQ